MTCRLRATSLPCLVLAAAALQGCKAKASLIDAPFKDDFERAEPGPLWNDTGGGYQIAGGNLNIKGAYNHPLWLRKRLPADVKIEFDAMSRSAAGDIKFEAFGDGETFDPDRGGYIASGYVFIFGGWTNSLSALCRQNEHDEGVKAKRADMRVEPGRTYHMEVTRKGSTIDWKVDGQPFLSFTDPEPLTGSGHEFFAFNNWEADVFFDNLTIQPL